MRAKIRKSCFSDTSGSNNFHELDLYLDLWIDRTDTHALRPSPTVNSATDDPAHTFKLARSYHSPTAFGFARRTPPALGTQQTSWAFFRPQVPAETWAPISFSGVIGLCLVGF